MNPLEVLHRLDRAIDTAEELLGAGRAFLERQTRLEQYMRGFSANDVLWSGSISFATSTSWQKSFPVDFAAISVYNFTAVAVDFANQPLPSSFHPGPGMFQTAAASLITVPIVGRVASVWVDGGTNPAPPVLVVVSARPLEPNGATL